jgi:hypothetical protein
MVIFRGVIHINGLHLAGNVGGDWGAAGGVDQVKLLSANRWSTKAAAER